jgi:hypothetical protein
MSKYLDAYDLFEKLQTMLSKIHEDVNCFELVNWPEYKWYTLGAKVAVDEIMSYLQANEITLEEIQESLSEEDDEYEECDEDCDDLCEGCEEVCDEDEDY